MSSNRIGRKAVEMLYNALPDAIEETDNGGNRSVPHPHWACAYSASMGVARLLTKKTPPAMEIKDKWGKTPFQRACECVALAEVMGALLEQHPASDDKKDAENSSSLEVVQMLQKGEGAASPSIIPSPTVNAAVSPPGTPSDDREPNDGNPEKRRRIIVHNAGEKSGTRAEVGISAAVRQASPCPVDSPESSQKETNEQDYEHRRPLVVPQLENAERSTVHAMEKTDLAGEVAAKRPSSDMDKDKEQKTTTIAIFHLESQKQVVPKWLSDLCPRETCVRPIADVRMERIKHGKCPTCGRQCYVVKKFRRIPITDTNRVSNGRCLNCEPVETGGEEHGF